MRSHHYDRADAEALSPLLDALVRELEERAARLEELEARIRELQASPFYSEELRELEAEGAVHRRELRHCHQELEGLGCSIVGKAPMTIRIPTRRGNTTRSLVWQTGHGVRS